MAVQPLSEVLVTAQRQASATAIATHQAQISAEVAGVVASIHAEVGQQVSEGDLLITLDATDYELLLADANAAQAAASARRALARQRLNDARQLSEKQFVSADDLALRDSELAVAQAELQRAEVAILQARRALEKTRLVAPFDAAVTSRSANTGQLLVTGSPVMQLVGLQPLELEALIPVAEMNGLRGGGQLRFEGAEGSFPVQWLRDTRVVEGATDAIRVRLQFTDQLPFPGESGVLRWQPQHGLVPPALLVQRNGQLGIFVSAQGRARFEPLPQAQVGRPASHALSPETLVVTRGHNLLSEGDSLTATGR